MSLKQIREALGIARVIWIDDVFGDPVIDLAVLARQQPQIQEEFKELAPAFAVEGFGDVDAELAQAIRDLDGFRRDQLRERLLQNDAEDAPSPELSAGTIEEACNRLGVEREDRWTFQQADAKLGEVTGNDNTAAYIIDLKEGGGLDQRGLEILAYLRSLGSRGVAFILTHEAAADTEASLEQKLMRDISPTETLAPPITVVSKGRLTEEGADIEAAFAIALKRAGLRRALHQVLGAASACASGAYASTASALLEVEPERLEQYVYERGRAEGVSELNVVERALVAGASKAMRTFFGTDEAVLQSIQWLRALQAVSLDNKALDAGAILSDLRNAEVWDESSVINASFTPLANGDVFRFDETDPEAPKSPKVFVLLGQPCDIMLRANGKRVSDVAMLVPLIELQEDGSPLPDPNDPEEDDSDKGPKLPFRLNGKRFKLNLKGMTYARLAVLDLACFRSDGCVRVEADHSPPSTLLPGGKFIYVDRTTPADGLLGGPMPDKPIEGARVPVDDRLLLTMSEVSPWDRVRLGLRLAAYTPPPGHHFQALPDRVTWFLRRDGRIRAPYSAFLLERALRTLGRRAFDSDYTS